MTLASCAALFDLPVPVLTDKLRNDQNDFWRWWWTQFASEQGGMRRGNLSDAFSPFRRVLNGIPVEPFLEEIEKAAENWNAASARKKIGVQQHTDSIMLRRPDFVPIPGEDDYQVVIDIHESQATKMADSYPKLMAYLENFSAQHGRGSLSRVVLVRLSPKKEVGPHYDNGFYYLCRDRYHLVLRSSGSKMECAGSRSTWSPGELWWFDNNLRHSASNAGDDWRIHVIFDVLPYRNKPLVDEFKAFTRYYRQNHPELVG